MLASNSLNSPLLARRKVSLRVWREGEGAEEEEDTASWTRSTTCAGGMGEGRDEMPFHCLKSILDDDWYVAATSGSGGNVGGSSVNQGFAGMSPPDSSLLLPAQVDSSCSPSYVFALDPSAHQAFFPHKPTLSSFLSAVCSNPFDAGFDFVSDNPTFLPPVNPNAATSVFGGGMLGSAHSLPETSYGGPAPKFKQHGR